MVIITQESGQAKVCAIQSIVEKVTATVDNMAKAATQIKSLGHIVGEWRHGKKQGHGVYKYLTGAHYGGPIHEL